MNSNVAAGMVAEQPGYTGRFYPEDALYSAPLNFKTRNALWLRYRMEFYRASGEKSALL